MVLVRKGGGDVGAEDNDHETGALREGTTPEVMGKDRQI